MKVKMISFEEFLAATIVPPFGREQTTVCSLQIFYKNSLYTVGPYMDLETATDEITLLTEFPIEMRNSWIPINSDDNDKMIICRKNTTENTFSFPDCHKFLAFIRRYSTEIITQCYTIVLRSGETKESFGKFSTLDDARSELLRFKFVESQYTVIINDMSGNTRHMLKGNDEIVTLSVGYYDDETKKFEDILYRL